ncbi:hypothetical protein ColKHC_08381 [Colletotrichum higginsianum]|nr:hypothetical protein ColKHC_08381 [Colletotrichum higginsianum]
MLWSGTVYCVNVPSGQPSEYRQQNQRKGEAGAFEINFVSESGAAHFPEAFLSAASGPSTGSHQAIEDAK